MPSTAVCISISCVKVAPNLPVRPLKSVQTSIQCVQFATANLLGCHGMREQGSLHRSAQECLRVGCPTLRRCLCLR